MAELAQPARVPVAIYRITWGELALALGALGAFACMALALLGFRESMEKNTVDVTVRNIASGLRWQVAGRLTQGRGHELAQLARANPVSFLAGPPAGYLGEREAPADVALPGASWYFDARSRELVYVPALAWHLRVEQGGRAELRWRVDAAKEIGTGADTGRTEGLMLVETTRRRWF